MSVVVAQNPLVIWLIQGQRAANAIWDIPRNHNPPRFDPDPVAIALIDDLIVKFDKSGDPSVFTRSVLYQLLIKFAMPY
jgi:hypothetical protein